MSELNRNNPYDSHNCVAKAASLLKHESLHDFYEICEGQKTISTKKIERMLDKLADDMRLHGIFLSEVAKRLRKMEQEIE